MYGTDGPRIEGEMMKQECKPDYERQASILKKRMDVFSQFKESLIKFVQVVGMHSGHQKASSLPELLGKVEIDCLEQEREYNILLSKIEDGS